MKISPRQEQHVKKYVKDYFEKVVAQKKTHEKKKAERRALQESKVGASKTAPVTLLTKDPRLEEHQETEQCTEMSDEERNDSKPGSATPSTPAGQGANGDGLKRKRIDGHEMEGTPAEEQSTPTKRLKSETPPPPPPPPPPPAGHTPQQSPLEDGNAPHPLARLKLQNHQAPEFINGAELANSEPESPADEDSILSPPDSRRCGSAVGDFQGIDDGLANVRMDQPPGCAPKSPTTGFGHAGDEGQGGAFGLQHLPGVPKLPVRSEA